MKASELLRRSVVSVSAANFNVVSVSSVDWLTLLKYPELSPRMTVSFMIFMDEFEVTLVLDDRDLASLLPGLDGAKIAKGYRKLTFDIVLELSVIGFMAEVSRILADAGVSILPLSAFSRDHLLIKQEQLATALKALGPHVAELC